MAVPEDITQYVSEAAPPEYAKFVQQYLEEVDEQHPGVISFELDRPNIELCLPDGSRIALVDVRTAEVRMAP